MNDKDILRPCPFCGHKAVIEPFKSRKGYEANALCTCCMANMHTITFDTEEEAEKEVIKAWNRRPDKPLQNGVHDSEKVCAACIWLSNVDICHNVKSQCYGLLMHPTDRCTAWKDRRGGVN